MATSRFFSGAGPRSDPEDFYADNENHRLPASAPATLPRTASHRVGIEHAAGNGGFDGGGENGVHGRGGEPDDLPDMRPHQGLVVHDLDGTYEGTETPPQHSGVKPLHDLVTPGTQRSAQLFGSTVSSGDLIHSKFTIRVPFLDLKNFNGDRYETNAVTDDNGFCWYLSIFYHGYSPAAPLYSYSSAFSNAGAAPSSNRSMSVFLTGHGCGSNLIKFEFKVDLTHDSLIEQFRF